MRRIASLQIVEPSEMLVEGIRSVLAGEDFNILAPLNDAATLKERLPVLSPDILLLNPTVMGSQAQQMMGEIRLARPNMPIVALVYEYVQPEVLNLFAGVVDVRMPRNKVASLLYGLMGDADTATEEQVDSYELSVRELDVLVLVAKGLSSKEIADRLNISIHTVNSHRKNITKKTGIKSVAGLAVYAMLHNLA